MTAAYIVALVFALVVAVISSVALFYSTQVQSETRSQTSHTSADAITEGGSIDPNSSVTVFYNTEPITTTLANGVSGEIKTFRLSSAFPVTVKLGYGSFTLTTSNPTRSYIAGLDGSWSFVGDSNTYGKVPNGETFSQQLTAASGRLGFSVAVTPNGMDLVSSVIFANANVGSIYSFHFDPITKLYVADAQGAFIPAANPTTTTSTEMWGYSLAMSDDGLTLAVAPQKVTPVAVFELLRAVVFKRSASGDPWVEQTTLYQIDSTAISCVASNATFMTMSSDGKVIAVGNQDDRVGSVAVFTSTDLLTWSQDGPKLTSADLSGFPMFGGSLDISNDGKTLITSAMDAAGGGAVYIFHNRDGWINVSGTVQPSAGASFGSKVYIDGDATTAVIEDEGFQGGTVYTYNLTGATGQLSNETILTLDGRSGYCGGISPDGTVVYTAKGSPAGRLNVFTKVGGTVVFHDTWVNIGPIEDNRGYGSVVKTARGGGIVIVNNWFDGSSTGNGLFIYQ